MAKKAKKDNKNVVIGLCAAVAIIVVVVVAVVLATNGNKLNDSYFVSDGTKYVLTIESDSTSTEEGSDEIIALKTHIVYSYSGDNVTGVKTYSEFKDADTAKKAYDSLKESGGEDMNNAVIDGKYIIITAAPEEYEGMTVADVKSQIEFMESLKNANFESTDSGELLEDSAEYDETSTKAEE